MEWRNRDGYSFSNPVMNNYQQTAQTQFQRPIPQYKFNQDQPSYQQHHRGLGKLKGKLKTKIINKLHENALLYGDFTPTHQDMMPEGFSPSMATYTPRRPPSPHLAPSTWRPPPGWAEHARVTPSPRRQPELSTSAIPTPIFAPSFPLQPTPQSLVPPSFQNAGRLIAHMPEDSIERRRLALSLMDEIDAYERLQQRVRMIPALPALRFRVGLARTVDGQTQHTERVLNMSELRALLEQSLIHAEDQNNQTEFGLSYENLVGLQRIHKGVADPSVYPTFIFHDLPESKNTCPVCLVNYEDGDELKIVPCLHIYHKECIDHWLTISKACPVCKTCVESGAPCDDPISAQVSSCCSGTASS